MGFPEIIILDEPTVGLDPKQILEIRELIGELKQDHTIIFSSHILSEVQAVCDHVLIIHHGKAVACGAPDELERQMADSVLTVTVRCTEQQLSEALGEIPEAEGFSAVPVKDGVTADITFTPGTDIREKLFFELARRQLPILVMKPAGATLEDVFIKLTTDSAAVKSEEPDEDAPAATEKEAIEDDGDI